MTMIIRRVILRTILILAGIAFLLHGSPQPVAAAGNVNSTASISLCSKVEARVYDKAVRAQLAAFHDATKTLSSPDDVELAQAYDAMRDIRAEVQSLDRPDCASRAHASVLAFMNTYLEAAQDALAHKSIPSGQMATIRQVTRSMARQLELFRSLSGLSH